LISNEEVKKQQKHVFKANDLLRANDYTSLDEIRKAFPSNSKVNEGPIDPAQLDGATYFMLTSNTQHDLHKVTLL
jgi:hypothetical protein